MALDKNALAAALKAAFQNAKDKAWSSDQVASALADAIDAFVLTADVSGVSVNVVNAGQPAGVGTQTGTGKLQ